MIRTPAFQLQAGDVVSLTSRPAPDAPLEARQHTVRSATFVSADRVLVETSAGATFQFYDDDLLEVERRDRPDTQPTTERTES